MDPLDYNSSPTKRLLERMMCSWIGHNDRTVPGTVGLKHGAEMKQCLRCERVGWVVFP